MNFENLTIDNGLSQATAEAIIQDSDGYVWIGTNDGLNRYNGSEIKVFDSNDEDENSIISNYIAALAEDKNKNLWVGTDVGLSKINLSAGPSEIVDNFTAEDIESYSKLYSPINYIKEDLPDTLIIHSKKDNIVPYDTSVELYESGIELNNKFDFYTLENCTHYLENLSNKEALGLYMNIIDFILSESK